MPKLVSFVGATGTQGESVVRVLLDLGEFSVRAITRDTQGSQAMTLAEEGVEVVRVDINDLVSLKVASLGSYAIFAVTNFFEALPAVDEEEAVGIEVQQGINLAKAAAATINLQHYIWSTLPNTHRLSHGKHIIPHYEAKNKADEYTKANTDFCKRPPFSGSPSMPLISNILCICLSPSPTRIPP